MSNPFTLRRDFMARFDMSLPATPHVLTPLPAMVKPCCRKSGRSFPSRCRTTSASSRPRRRNRRGCAPSWRAEGVDVLNVLLGLLSQGLPVEKMFDAIHAANLLVHRR